MYLELGMVLPACHPAGIGRTEDRELRLILGYRPEASLSFKRLCLKKKKKLVCLWRAGLEPEVRNPCLEYTLLPTT